MKRLIASLAITAGLLLSGSAIAEDKKAEAAPAAAPAAAAPAAAAPAAAAPAAATAAPAAAPAAGQAEQAHLGQLAPDRFVVAGVGGHQVTHPRFRRALLEQPGKVRLGMPLVPA